MPSWRTSTSADVFRGKRCWFAVPAGHVFNRTRAGDELDGDNEQCEEREISLSSHCSLSPSNSSPARVRLNTCPAGTANQHRFPRKTSALVEVLQLGIAGPCTQCARPLRRQPTGRARM